MAKTKRLIEIDDELLDAARDALGTAGISDTVRVALRNSVAAVARAREIEWLIAGGMAEMADKDKRDEVWR